MNQLFEIINGSLLGDACVYVYKNKYFSYKYTAKDKNFLLWLKPEFEKFGLEKCYTRIDNKISNTFLLGFYINSCPYKEFLKLREKWYKIQNGKTQKILPDDLEITPTTLLFWYLGDGCLVRRKNDENRVPTVILATNCFSKEDVDFLVEKLREQNLNFYPVEYQSGFKKGEKCGYALYSKNQDGTPLRFFQIIGIECPKGIANCSTGRKGVDHQERFFRDKWPTEDDWVKILSNTDIGYILRQRRLEMGLSQKQLGEVIGIRRENIRDVELGKRHFCVKNFRKTLEAANLNPRHLLGRANPDS